MNPAGILKRAANVIGAVFVGADGITSAQKTGRVDETDAGGAR